MSEPIYLHAMNQFLGSSDISESELKIQLKQNFNVISRRTSRLTLLALLGVLPLQPKQRSGVYLSSNFSSPSNMYELEMHVFQHKTPRPFNFINSINNAVSFYVAQTLDIQGPNLFVATETDSWAQLLLPAIVDLKLGLVEQALVGWCYERRQQVDHSTQEGSHWLLLSKQRQNAIAELMIEDSEVIQQDACSEEDYYYQPIIHVFEKINHQQKVIHIDKLLIGKRLVIKTLAHLA